MLPCCLAVIVAVVGVVVSALSSLFFSQSIASSITHNVTEPHILELPHPARTLGECDVVLFTKDPQREYKDKLAAAQVERVKVIGIDKLRKKYVEYEAKRQLCAAHEVGSM